MIDANSLTRFFPTDYADARQRFLAACRAHEFHHEALDFDVAGPDGDTLAIDVAMGGTPSPERILVVSSGLHGVESPLGVAMQLAILEELWGEWQPPKGVGVLLLHVLNPFGFAWRRRFNENNVDLNRNFLLANQVYEGAPPLAGKFQSILGPRRKPTRLGGSSLRMGYLAARHGKQSFWSTLPVGQYEMPDWIFYGGRELAQTGRLLSEALPRIVGAAREVIHFDFHTGLGRWANCELLLSEDSDPDEVQWWRGHFPKEQVIASHGPSRYAIRGGFGPWLAALFPNCRYHFATAEFGTYSARHVLAALANECRCTSVSADATLPPNHWSRRRLAEAFAPANVGWRTTCCAKGLGLIEQAQEFLG